MSRPVTIDKEQILEAARTVFMRDGFKGKTAEIAGFAGVSEGSLFRHFKTKTNLFLAAMASETGESEWEEQLMKSAGSSDVRSSLETIGNRLLQRLRLILPRLIMVSSSGITLPANYQRQGTQPPPLRHIQTLTKFFRAENAAGRLSVANPEILAHAFLGALSHYAWCEVMFNYKPSAPSNYVKAIVDNILKANNKQQINR